MSHEYILLVARTQAIANLKYFTTLNSLIRCQPIQSFLSDLGLEPPVIREAIELEHWKVLIDRLQRKSVKPAILEALHGTSETQTLEGNPPHQRQRESG